MDHTVNLTRARITAATTAVVLLTACADSDTRDQGAAESITVFAAASLHEVFEDIAELYTEETGTAVTFNVAGSSGLVEQLENGAPADVLATADEATMERAVEGDLIAGEPALFAENYLVIVTPADNPAGVQSLADLGDDAVETVICAEQVPCGAATGRITEASGVQITPVSEETSVTDVLGRVRNGEAEAGLVYATDALQAGDEVEAIEIEGAEEDPNLYPIAVVDHAAEPEAGEEFIDFVLTDEQAQQILTEAGFVEPQEHDAA
ncbi:molybdate ABC transporter substrate-binding protein [Nesterenkonia alba]|uniref:molybdate ABC transporter substrate-binding protein n=1 Tax=Nesterenkonia alba TaxID=515814 RepID=UPI0003B71180|nr:molybdate ABC transporter substrate-binding protein [Nesterenkonia alba]